MSASASREQILAARAAINRAIAGRDPNGIAAYLLPGYQVVTSQGVHRDGREASVASWAGRFAHDPNATYSRMPDEIHVSEDFAMAQEHGRWTGTVSTAEGLLDLAGVYAAKWHRTEEGWRLEAEIFTLLRSNGPA